MRWFRGAHVALWPVLDLVVTVGTQFILTPLLLHRLGQDQFGVWIIVQSTLLASTALSLGASAGLLPFLAATLNRGDIAGARAAMRWFARRTVLVSSLVLAFIAIVISTGFVPGGLSGAAQESAWPLALATLAWMAATEFDSGLSSALKARGRFGLVAQVESAARIAQVILLAAMVEAGSTALIPILISLALTVMKALFRRLALRRHDLLHYANSDPAESPNEVPRELVSTGIWIWIGMLGSLTFNAFDRWFIAAWFGTSVLASYAICTQIAQMPHSIVSAAGQVLVPWAARHRNLRSHTLAERHALRLLIRATMLSALPSLLLLPILGPLLGLWISRSFAIEHLNLAQALSVVFLLLSLNVPGYFLLLGLGYARFSTVVVSISGVVLILGALLLPQSLTLFVALKGLFALIALSLPIGCFLLLRKR